MSRILKMQDAIFNGMYIDVRYLKNAEAIFNGYVRG